MNEALLSETIEGIWLEPNGSLMDQRNPLIELN